MGIVNVTPDSFSDGGQFFDAPAAIAHARQLAREGADIIDVGGESTRPGATPVSAEEELRRVIPVIKGLCGPRATRGKEEILDGARKPSGTCTSSDAHNVPVSVDTRRAAVARAAVTAGATMINDVAAGREPGMLEAMADAGSAVAVVLMHMHGEPDTMQNNPRYENVVAEVAAFLCGRAEAAQRAGIDAQRIVLDPGIGFGKLTAHNLALLKNIDALADLGYPVLVGASRKRFLGDITGAASDARLAGSLAVAAHCYANGVDVVRVHDVRETVELFDVLDASGARRIGKNA